MKKIILLSVLSVLILSPKNTTAQNKGANAAIAVAGILALGSGIAAIKQMEEQLELSGTQWVLGNRNDISNFYLEAINFNATEMSDVSNTSVVAFKVTEIEMNGIPTITGKRRVLFCFTSRGWVTQYGLDSNKVKWFLIDEDEWLNMMVSYVKVASENKDEASIRELLPIAQIEKKGVKLKKEIVLPFYKINGDSYFVSDYSDKMKLVYNEKSLGIFLKETNDLVQLSRLSLRDIHDFLFYRKKISRIRESERPKFGY
jgi:hypothetical protein